MVGKVLVLALLLPSLAFSYTVIRKDGRPFSGDLVKSTADTVVVRDSRGIEVTFRVNQLDLEKTKAANVPGAAESKGSSGAAPATTGVKRLDDDSGWTGEPISMDFKDIDIRDFFRFIAEISGMNMILDPQVKGTLTLKLKDVPWDQALDLVCRTNGLGYEVDGNVMSVNK